MKLLVLTKIHAPFSGSRRRPPIPTPGSEPSITLQMIINVHVLIVVIGRRKKGLHEIHFELCSSSQPIDELGRLPYFGSDPKGERIGDIGRQRLVQHVGQVGENTQFQGGFDRQKAHLGEVYYLHVYSFFSSTL